MHNSTLYYGFQSTSDCSHDRWSLMLFRGFCLSAGRDGCQEKAYLVTKFIIRSANKRPVRRLGHVNTLLFSRVHQDRTESREEKKSTKVPQLHLTLRKHPPPNESKLMKYRSIGIWRRNLHGMICFNRLVHLDETRCAFIIAYEKCN